MKTLEQLKKERDETVAESNRIWLESEPVRNAQEAALVPWHAANRKIDGLKAMIELLEKEGQCLK